jgi:5-(carboxyamino)imidazole ribonucleotide mutase
MTAGRLGIPILVRDRTVQFLFCIGNTKIGGDAVKKVAVIMGSTSDLPVVQKAIDTLREFKVPTESHVYSAHRTPEAAAAFARAARESGFGVILAAAGMAAHLAGALAANTTLPIVGIPIASGGLGGLDALLSTVQMPSGIPVATVAVNGAANAALLAVQILAVEDEGLAAALDEKRRAAAEAVLQKDAELNG